MSDPDARAVPAVLSVRAAASLANVSRSTIQRAAASGRLSREPGGGIQVVELERVFGPLTMPVEVSVAVGSCCRARRALGRGPRRGLTRTVGGKLLRPTLPEPPQQPEPRDAYCYEENPPNALGKLPTAPVQEIKRRRVGKVSHGLQGSEHQIETDDRYYDEHKRQEGGDANNDHFGSIRSSAPQSPHRRGQQLGCPALSPVLLDVAP